jgi:hypothetical protein
MENRVQIETSGNLVEVQVTGKLTKEMYEELVPLLERQIRDQGKLCVLFVMRDFHGWTAGALWDDLRFDLRHFRDILRLAIVGEKRWQRGMAVFCRPFTTAKVEYFEANQLEAAREWLGKPTHETAGRE